MGLSFYEVGFAPVSMRVLLIIFNSEDSYRGSLSRIAQQEPVSRKNKTKYSWNAMRSYKLGSDMGITGTMLHAFREKEARRNIC